MKKIIIAALLAFTSIVSFSCSKLQKVLKSEDLKYKYEQAMIFYDKEDYFKAAAVFEDIYPISKGHDFSEKLHFCYANSNFQEKNYELSEHYFKLFYQTYGRSTMAEEAHFIYTKSLYLKTPGYNLDQSNTRAAIEGIQGFIDKYPQSKFKEESTKMIDKLQLNLEMKAFFVAKQYYNIKMYKAAITAFQNYQKDYPDSDYQEETAYLMVNAQYEMSAISILSVQEERLIQAIAFYNQFVDKYASGKYMKAAEKIYDDTLKLLDEARAAKKAEKEAKEKELKEKAAKS